MIVSTSLAATPVFHAGITQGNIQNASITEASGIASSWRNPNVLWTHNDSGGGINLFAMTPAGANLGAYSLTGATNTDWEDIAIGPGPTAGASYLYIADIGDNSAVRNDVSVYRVAEPAISDTQSPVTSSISGASKFTFAYPNGPHDAESLFVDPLTRDIYIVSKRLATKYVYRAAYPQSTSGTTTMTLVASLTNSDWITAADISPDGDEIIMRAGATDTGLLYQRPAGGTVGDAFATTPSSIPLLAELQGEAIGFDPNGWGYYTTSEFANGPVHYYNRLAPPAAMYWDNDSIAAGNRTTGTSLGGSGTWNTSTQKWYNGHADVLWSAGNDAIFTGAAGTVTLGTAQSVNSLAFKSSGYTITASTLTLTGSSVTVDSGVATISSVLAGSSGLVKNGAGTLVLTSSSNQTSGYTGGTTINSGTLNISSGAMGRSGTGVTINNAAALQFTGDFTLAAARPVTLGPGGGVIDVQNFSDTIAGVISGSSLTKTGAGTLTLTNTNTYTGTTTVAAGTLVLTESFTTGSSISISSGATMRLPAGSASVIKTGSLSIPASAKLDVGDNKLIVTGMSRPAVEAFIATGRGDGTWNGSSGVVTQVATATSSVLTTLAIATAGEVGYAGGTFGGVTVAGDDVLLMYTWGGDANLDGELNGDDYFAIDSHVLQSGSVFGFHNGDFDYNGEINGDDYFVLDSNILQAQASPPFPAGAVVGLAPIPEPGALGLVAALAMLKRRRSTPARRCKAPEHPPTPFVRAAALPLVAQPRENVRRRSSDNTLKCVS